MNRFNLDNLPLCGAKTKSGTTCKRRGNKRNGRCRFHGGSSTGPKSREGKTTSSQNATLKIPSWALGKVTEKEKKLFEDACLCIDKLKRLIRHDRIINSDEINRHIGEHRVALEVMKYIFINEGRTSDFLLTQSALDHFYQDSDAIHLRCHKYFLLITSRQLPRLMSQSQRNLFHDHLERSADREMKKLHQNFNNLFGEIIK